MVLWCGGALVKHPERVAADKRVASFAPGLDIIARRRRRRRQSSVILGSDVRPREREVRHFASHPASGLYLRISGALSILDRD